MNAAFTSELHTQPADSAIGTLPKSNSFFMSDKTLIHMFAKMNHLCFSLQCVQDFVKSVSDQMCSSDYLTLHLSLENKRKKVRTETSDALPKPVIHTFETSIVLIHLEKQSWSQFLSKVLPYSPRWEEAQPCALTRKTLLGRSGSGQEDWPQDRRCYSDPWPTERGDSIHLFQDILQATV